MLNRLAFSLFSRMGRLGGRLASDPLIDAEEKELGFFADLWKSVTDWWDALLRSYRGVESDSNGSMTTAFVILGLCIGIIAAIWIVTISRRRYGAFVRSLLRAGANGPSSAKTLAELGFEGEKGRAVRRGLLHNVDLRRVVKCVEEEAALGVANDGAKPGEPTEKKRTAEAPDAAAGVSAGDIPTGDVSVTGTSAADVPAGAGKDVFVLASSDTDGGKEKAPFDLKAHVASGEARFYIREQDLYLAGSRYDVRAERLLTPILTTVVTLVAMFLLLKWMPDILTAAAGLVKGIGGS